MFTEVLFALAPVFSEKFKERGIPRRQSHTQSKIQNS